MVNVMKACMLQDFMLISVLDEDLECIFL
jgi:hypothetical protein